MRVLYPGHRYALKNLKSEGETILQFRQDAPLHPEVEGTSCQEVLRALIDRVRVLDAEKPFMMNRRLINLMQEAIAIFEARALLRKVEKGMKIEKLSIGPDGHLIFREENDAAA